jgi:beta-lactamase regulating signal transducer with metallopeptidase domain
MTALKLSPSAPAFTMVSSQNELTVLPSLTTSTAFLAFQQSFATVMAIASQRLLAWLVGSLGGGSVFIAITRVIERDREGDASAACRGGYAEGL